MSQIYGVGRIAQLIVNYLQLAELLAGIVDGLYKVLAIVAVQPCSTNDEETAAELLYISLTLYFGGTISADGIRGIGFIQRNTAILTAAEYIVGGHMHQLGTDLLTGHSQVARAHSVGLESHIVHGLTAVYIGEGGTVYYHIGSNLSDVSQSGLQLGNIYFGQVYGYDLSVLQRLRDRADLAVTQTQLLLDLSTQLTFATSDQNFHNLVLLFLIFKIVIIFFYNWIPIHLPALKRPKLKIKRNA